MFDNLAQAKTLLLKACEGELNDNNQIAHAVQLAAFIQKEAILSETRKEKKFLSEMGQMVQDNKAKALMTEMTDQIFRSSSYLRSSNQFQYLIDKIGIPKVFSYAHRFLLGIFKSLNGGLASLFMPFVKLFIREKTARVILPGEPKALQAHLKERKNAGIRLNINHLGEAILGELEAKQRLSTYYQDLENPDIEYISIKISTLFSQINLLDWDRTLQILSERYKALLLKAEKHPYVHADGTVVAKFVNLDMEEYRDLDLTVALFKQVMSDPECWRISGGVVLQSYLPDSFLYQQDLTSFACERVAKGGAPIRIRIVKGANLAMEIVESSIKGWPLAPYGKKEDVDANFKKMIDYAFSKLHLEAVKIGVGSHNLFDIAYALILACQRNSLDSVTFEMLEGMAEPCRRVIQKIAGSILLYCPVAKKQEFQNAVAYLIRRLDENTGPQNFLRVAFNLQPDTSVWNKQAEYFAKSVLSRNSVFTGSHRTQNRSLPPLALESVSFQNEVDTDWSLSQNRHWAKGLMEEWQKMQIPPIPLVIDGQEILKDPAGRGEDPSRPNFLSYQYQLAKESDVEACVHSAQRTLESIDTGISLKAIAQGLRENRGRLMGAMLRDVGKPFLESDAEVSEAIDFAEYYQRSKEAIQELQGVAFKPKGVVLVASPWNFPCSIAAGGIVAALISGNAVIFKPAPEAVLVGYELAKIFWNAGVSKKRLQFIPCEDKVASGLVKSPDVNSIVLTGATATAELFFQMRPGLDLLAETGGKNTLIVTNLADRDLAIRDIVQSAFGFSGQKCSACSLVILEEEVFKDPHFKKQLKDAIESLHVGSAYLPASKVNPLIHPPVGALKESLKECDWFIPPKISPDNPCLMTPGVKWGVKQDSFLYKKELFGPVLGIMQAKDLEEAIEIANGTPYGLTAGLHSLDVREHEVWLEKIKAGNCYINRGITGAIVERQPFGGTKRSSFGPGLKAGGPNYLLALMHVEQWDSGNGMADRAPLPPFLQGLMQNAKYYFDEKTYKMLLESAGSYSYFWKYFFSKDHDPMKLKGQMNIQRYRPYERICLRVGKEDRLADVFRVYMAAHICKAALEISVPEERREDFKTPLFICKFESDEDFLKRLENQRIRLISEPSRKVVEGLSKKGLWQFPSVVLCNGRIELLHYLREISISYDYHRYGNLGERHQNQSLWDRLR